LPAPCQIVRSWKIKLILGEEEMPTCGFKTKGIWKLNRVAHTYRPSYSRSWYGRINPGVQDQHREHGENPPLLPKKRIKSKATACFTPLFSHSFFLLFNPVLPFIAHYFFSDS
jgi:hypothetical protein